MTDQRRPGYIRRPTDDLDIIVAHNDPPAHDSPAEAGELERRRAGKKAIAEIRARLDAIRQKGQP